MTKNENICRKCPHAIHFSKEYTIKINKYSKNYLHRVNNNAIMSTFNDQILITWDEKERREIMKNMMKKAVVLALAGTMAMGIFAGCGKSSDTLVMATNATFPPYEYHEGNSIVGIDVEIANAIGEKIGKKIEIEDVEFDSIVAGVQSGKYDFGMAGMTVTDERKKNVNFSDPYTTAVQSVIVPEDSAIASVDDITSDMKIGVQQGTTGDIYASGDYGEDAVTKYKSGPDAVQALLAGKVDLVIIDNQPAKSYVAANEGLKILDTAYAEEEYAIAINKQNDELLKEVNTALSELQADGTIDSIIKKYIKD